jgi:hypothetical protein
MTEKISVTFFTDWYAGSMRCEALTLAELGGRIQHASAASKEALEWLKLARFGNRRTQKGSLRHDSNLIAITGIEIDLDKETLSFDEVVEIVEKAGLEALVYSSPSHLLNGHGPRLRVLLPTGQERPPQYRDHLVARAAGLFRDGRETVVSGESWTRSQSYYFGAVGHNPEHRVRLIEGEHIDDLDELDQIALGKPATKTAGGTAAPGASGPADEEALADQILTGESYHQAAIRLLGVWARRGVALVEAERRLRAIFDRAEAKDQRWEARVAEIPRLLGHVWGKRRPRRTPAPLPRSRSRTFGHTCRAAATSTCRRASRGRPQASMPSCRRSRYSMRSAHRSSKTACKSSCRRANGSPASARSSR